eukprot:6486108-Amphidinium_carterae.2
MSIIRKRQQSSFHVRHVVNVLLLIHIFARVHVASVCGSPLQVLYHTFWCHQSAHEQHARHKAAPKLMPGVVLSSFTFPGHTSSYSHVTSQRSFHTTT